MVSKVSKEYITRRVRKGPQPKETVPARKEELCDDEEDKEPMIPTIVLKASPEALGVWKKAQKMLAKACKEMNRYQQMIDQPKIHEKSP